MTDIDMEIAFIEHMEAMKTEIEETGECSIPPFSFIPPECESTIVEGLRDA
jgi:hypothetical protein